MSPKRMLNLAATFGILLAISFSVGPLMTGALLVIATLVALLWIVRGFHDSQRSQTRAQLLRDTGAEPVARSDAIEHEIVAFGSGLRDWIMRGYPTGITEFWVRDAWRMTQTDIGITVCELQTTPGHSGFLSIPVWRVRHGALLWQCEGPGLDKMLIEQTRAALELPSSADLFCERQADQLLLVWRKHPFTPLEMLRLLRSIPETGNEE